MPVQATDPPPLTWGGPGLDIAGGGRGPDGVIYLVGVTSSFGVWGQNAMVMKTDGQAFYPITSGGAGVVDVWSWSGGSVDIYGGAVSAAGKVYFMGCTAFYAADGRCYGDTLLLRYDAVAGTLDWEKIVDTIDPSDDDYADAMAADADGNLYLAGGLNQGGFRDALLIKLDPDGSVLWAKTWDAGYDDSFNGVAIGADGTIYAAGNRTDDSFRMSALMAQYDPDGQLQWARTWRNSAYPTGEDDAFGVAAHPSGGAVAVGASHALGEPNDQLVLRFDENGTVSWAAILENPLDRDLDGGTVIVDASGYTYVGGSTEQSDLDAPDVAVLMAWDDLGGFVFAKQYLAVSAIGDLPSFFSSLIDDGSDSLVVVGATGDRYSKFLPYAGSLGTPTDPAQTPNGTSGSVNAFSYLTLGTSSTAAGCVPGDPAEPSCGWIDVMQLHLTRVCIDLDTGGCGGTGNCLGLSRGYCATASPVSGDHLLIEGDLSALSFSGGSVDLGTARCVGGTIEVDRVMDLSPTPESGTGSFYLSRDTLTEIDFGAASSGERRDVVVVDEPCP
jgi:hypothetical protein